MLGFVTAADNSVAAAYDYVEFGAPRSSGANAVPGSIRWHGWIRDPETGLYFARARYYDPDLRRFISEDPIGIEGGIHQYAYAGNDPIN